MHSDSFKPFINCGWWIIEETNFPHKFLLINAQVLRTSKAFENGSLTNIKFSKTQLSKIIQLGKFLSILLVLLSIHSIMISYAEEPKNMNRKKLINKDPD